MAKKRLGRIAVVFAVALTTCIIWAPPSSSSPVDEPVEGSPGPMMQRQLPLIALDEQVDALLEKNEAESARGFTSKEMDVENLAYTVFWKGPIPPQIKEVLDALI